MRQNTPGLISQSPRYPDPSREALTLICVVSSSRPSMWQSMWFRLHKFQKNLDESIYAVCLSCSGHLILAGGMNTQLTVKRLYNQNLGSSGSVKIWDTSGELEDEIHISSAVLHITWVELRSYHDTFFVASEDGCIRLYCHQPVFVTPSCWMSSLLFKVVQPSVLSQTLATHRR
jgi:WD40 repeat protein